MLVIVAVLFFGISFYYMNNQVVEINYMSFSGTIALPLLLLLTLCVGMVLGYIAYFSSSMKLRRNLSAARRELKNLGAGTITSSSGSTNMVSKSMESAGH